ncbi:UL16-binding protein 1-like [Trichechus manatus latirostris]|uniref:UL16-binding protein 1-like n=1 Tax=Trichechus manatus latirostris TaxID=127582 RepID=A0A2Y9QXI3_TRIMA|nr:UL16-binding protein 1-like [Trichechus manatus latirostris]
MRRPESAELAAEEPQGQKRRSLLRQNPSGSGGDGGGGGGTPAAEPQRRNPRGGACCGGTPRTNQSESHHRLTGPPRAEDLIPEILLGDGPSRCRHTGAPLLPRPRLFSMKPILGASVIVIFLITGSSSPHPNPHLRFSLVDAHSLCYNFSSRQQRYIEIQGQVDGRTFLYYDYGSNNVITLGPLGTKVNGTDEWRDQTETLRDAAKLFKELLLDIKLENYKIRAPLTLQAKMCCQHKDGKRTRAFWQFGFDGYVFLLFDSENMKWSEGHPGSRLMRETWEKNETLKMFFLTTSQGDCHRWLERFLAEWEKMLEPTAPVTMAATTAQANTAITPSPWMVLLIFSCSILLGTQGL